MQIPSAIIEIAKEESRRHSTTIQEAVCSAKARIEALPNYEELADTLITQAVQDLIYDARHRDNREINKEIRRSGGNGNGGDRRYNGGGPRRVAITDPSINRVYQSAFDYRISGQILGNLRGKDLIPIANSEKEISKGHIFNYVLLKAIAESNKVGDEETVQQKITEEELNKMFIEARTAVFGSV